MDVFKWAVASAVVALVAGQQLSAIEPARRKAIWASLRGETQEAPAQAVAAPERTPLPVSSPVAAEAAPTWPGEETIAPDRFGQFHTAVEISGQRLAAMIDTGASYLSLTYEDADRLGIRPAAADFKYAISTANGRAFVARVDLPAVRLGSLEVRNVPALVSGRGHLSETLVGMSFLSRLSGMKVDRGRLHLSR